MKKSDFPVYAMILIGLALVAGCTGTKDPGPVSREFYLGRFATRPDQGQTAAPDSLLIVSYNIAYAKETERAARELLDHPRLNEVDVLLLQEMDAEQSELLARQLGMDYVYAPAYIHARSERRYGTTVLSRWPITASKGLVLPHPNPFSSNHRRAVAADITVGSHQVRVVSVHLSTIVIALEDRLDQVATLIDSLTEPGMPTIIGGDFNTVSSPGLLDLRQEMRHAGFRQVRLPGGKTAKSRAIDLINYDLVLDHFFYRDLEAGRSGIADAFTASDHLPIWAVFRWPD